MPLSLATTQGDAEIVRLLQVVKMLRAAGAQKTAGSKVRQSFALQCDGSTVLCNACAPNR
jgi:hypothetical protein